MPVALSLWTALLVAALLACLFALGWWLHVRFWLRRLSLTMPYASEEVLLLPDGGTIELRRVSLPRPDGPARPPVLLVHGIASNHRTYDTTPDASLARFLHEHGRDVWLLTLRTGRSQRFVFGARPHLFKAMVQYDLPLAVEAVLTRTNREQLDLGVFSMGGMVLYASLGRTLDPRRLHRVLVFASPGDLRPSLLARYLPLALTPTVPVRLLMRSVAFASSMTPRFLARYFYNPQNLAPAVLKQSMVDMLEDIPGSLGAEMMRWAAHGGDILIDDERALDGLARIDVPACFFVGSADWLAPVRAVRTAYEAWGRENAHCEKSFLVLGRETGAREEYGHADLLLGARAREEVFEPALCFLETGGRRAAREAVRFERVRDTAL